MFRYVVIMTILVMEQHHHRASSAPPGMRLTIDCGSQEKSATRSQVRAKSSESGRSNDNLGVNNICDFIQNSLPKTVKDGRFIIRASEPDQTGYDTDPIPIGVAPPKSFIPKLEKRLKLPKIQIPKLYVPKLKTYEDKPAPKIGSPMRFHIMRTEELASSAEKMEKIKKAVQKLLHVVKVLGRIDEYISERMKIIVEKIAQTFE